MLLVQNLRVETSTVGVARASLCSLSLTFLVSDSYARLVLLLPYQAMPTLS